MNHLKRSLLALLWLPSVLPHQTRFLCILPEKKCMLGLFQFISLFPSLSSSFLHPSLSSSFPFILPSRPSLPSSPLPFHPPLLFLSFSSLSPLDPSPPSPLLSIH